MSYIEEKLKGQPEELLEFLGEIKEKEVDGYIAEYNGDRTQRDDQVGNRRDKPKKDGGSVPVNKIPIQFQKKIVRTASGFLFGEPVNIVSEEPNDSYSEFLSQWKKLRMDGKLLEMCTTCKAYTESAMLFRITEDSVGEPTLKAQVLRPDVGKLIPVMDSFGDMVAFAYQVQGKNEEGEDVDYTYLYEQTAYRVFVKTNEGVDQLESKPHGFDRIPVIYVEQDAPEWDVVQALIDRYEYSFSRFADANDYFSSPFFKAVGKVENLPEKDATGSVYMLDIISTQNGNIVTSDLDVISWDRAPESVKLEFETLKSLIYDLADTPDLSFDNVKGLGNIAGVALEMMFLNSKLKSKYDMIIFEPALQRMVNILKAGMIAMSLMSESELEIMYEVIPNSIMPDDIQSHIDLLVSATGNKPVMSQRTAVGYNKMVEDKEEEMKLIEDEQQSDLGESLDFSVEE